jgi:hypothetical protein
MTTPRNGKLPDSTLIAELRQLIAASQTDLLHLPEPAPQTDVIHPQTDDSNGEQYVKSGITKKMPEKPRRERHDYPKDQQQCIVFDLGLHTRTFAIIQGRLSTFR